MNRDSIAPKLPEAPTQSFDAALDRGLGAAFGEDELTSGGWSRPPLLRDEPSDFSPIVRPDSAEMTKADPGRYQLFGEIARGGMGVILKGRDPDLGRDLAVKVLRAEYAGRSVSEQRFVEEAQVGGQLQHPGVVPVYELGRFADSRPYFTMKLVKGRTLSHLLADRPTPVAHAPGSPSDRGRFLKIFEQIAQTIAYAHSKGVIHRDIKPANVMVGNFGEVQVMDWGLAKVLPQGGIADEDKEKASRERKRPENAAEEIEPTVIRTIRSGSTGSGTGSDTEAGSMMGTPAYMPPEQAGGEMEKLDERADVFGLGAVLCVILTGEPPYVADDGEKLRLMALRGNLEECLKRLDACEADAELVSLCKRCLEREPSNRPRHGGEVADAIHGYLAEVEERAHKAEVERARSEAESKEQRKKRKVQLALAAAVVGLMLGGGAFAFWRAEQAQAGRERDARNGEAVASLLNQAEEALKADDAAKAAVVLEAARKRSAEGGAETDADRLKRLDANLALLRDLDVVDQFRWTVEENKFQDPAAVATRTREALTRFGADPDTVSVDEAAARVSASVVRERIVAALDRLLRYQKTAGVRVALRKVDADPYRDAVRDAIFANDRARIVELAGQKAALEQPPGFAAFLGESGVIPVERKRQLLQAAVSQRPGDLGLLMTLGNSYPSNQADGADERLRWFQAAVAAAPANAAAHNNLGLVLSDKKDLVGAEAAYREALRLDPKLAPVHFNLANILNAKPDREGAEAAIREAIRLDPKLAVAHSNLGVLLQDKRDLVGAEAAVREAIRLDPKYAMAHNNLGNVLYAKPDLVGAEAAYREAIRLDPKNAQALYNLGNVLRAKRDLVGAEAAYHEAIRLDPKYANAHNNLGGVLENKGDLVGAEAAFREAIRLDPKNANAHSNLGVLLRAKRDLVGGEAAFREAIRLDPKYANAHNSLGVLLQAKRDLVGAEAAFREAIRLDPKNANAHNSLGARLHNDKRDLVGAEAAFREAIRLDPKYANAHDNLGVVLRAKRDLVGAEAAFREAIRLDPKDAKAHGNLGNLLRAKPDLVGAEAAYREAIRLDPMLANAHNGLGIVLLSTGRYSESKATLDLVLVLLPENHPTRMQVSRQVQACERMLKLEARLPKLLRGEDKVDSAPESLSVAQMCQHKKLYAAGARFSAEAFAADPKLADDLQAGHRYNAACSAALATAGQGEDAAKLDDTAKAKLRGQALDWLKADLTAWEKLLDSGPPQARPTIVRQMRHWQKDPDLAGIRDAAALAKFPKEERAAWEKLWAEVESLRAASAPKELESLPTPKGS